MKRLPILLLLLAVVAFAFGLAHLFRLRFAAGDIYPAYSSFRADPLGTKAFYRSLSDLLTTRRNFQPLSKVRDGKDTTLFYLGAPVRGLEFTPADYTHFESFLQTGGRLVFALAPSFQQRAPGRTTGLTPTPGPTPAPKRPPSKRPDEPAELKPIPITDRWGLKFGHADPPKNTEGVFEPAHASRKSTDPLPDSLACHSSLFFEQLHAAWRVIYARPNDRAVLIERRFGDGTLVLCADAYPLSNEALREDRQTALLAWMVGPSRNVVFDEVHLGVEENPGIAALARKYRLHGLFAALLVLAALFIWSNAVPFLPPYAAETKTPQAGMVAGHDSAAGFIHLLRRNLRGSDLLGTCLIEWKKSCAREVPRAKLEQLQAVIDAENAREPKERDAIRTYTAISRILSRKPELETRYEH